MEGGKRFWEIDFARGIGILMMIIFHVVFDLNYFHVIKIAINSGFWFYFARATASIFILVSGISLAISSSRWGTGKYVFLKNSKRASKIFGLGLGISLVTWFFIGKNFVRFGILHLIGAGIFFGYPFLRFKLLNLILGIIFILFGLHLQSIAFDFPWLIWAGFFYPGFYSVDYTPVFPWFGLMLVGIFLGNVCYPKGFRKFGFPEVKNPLSGFLGFLGRRSLFIYLIHQPIIIAILSVFILKRFPF